MTSVRRFIMRSRIAKLADCRDFGASAREFAETVRGDIRGTSSGPSCRFLIGRARRRMPGSWSEDD
jgi:hypothetical protein